MKHSMKKLIVGFVAAASAASIAYADSSTPAKPEFVEIDVTVTKDHGKSVDLLSKVSMRTEKDKLFVTADRRTIKFRSGMARANDENYNFDRTSEISVGVDAAYIPAVSSANPDMVAPEQVVVTIDEASNWSKVRLPETQEAIELPDLTTMNINVPIHPGRTNVVSQGNYTVTVTEHAASN